MSESKNRAMQVFYNRHSDTLLLELAPRRHADHVLRTGSVILHVGTGGEPILLEIEGASEFLSIVIRLDFEITVYDWHHHAS